MWIPALQSSIVRTTGSLIVTQRARHTRHNTRPRRDGASRVNWTGATWLNARPRDGHLQNNGGSDRRKRFRHCHPQPALAQPQRCPRWRRTQKSGGKNGNGSLSTRTLLGGLGMSFTDIASEAKDSKEGGSRHPVMIRVGIMGVCSKRQSTRPPDA